MTPMTQSTTPPHNIPTVTAAEALEALDFIDRQYLIGGWKPDPAPKVAAIRQALLSASNVEKLNEWLRDRYLRDQELHELHSRDVAELRAGLANVERERDEALEWSRGWHGIVETACTIVGISSAGGGAETRVALQMKLGEIMSENSENAGLRARVETLTGALKPFAENVEALNECPDDDAVVVPEFIPGSDLVVCDVGDLRAARKALEAGG